MPQAEGGGVVHVRKKDVVKPSPKYDTPTTPQASKGIDRSLVDRVVVSADRTDEIYRTSVTDLDLFHTPDTTYYTAGVKNDAVTTAVKSEVLSFFSQIYGGDPSRFMAAELLPEPQRTRTLAALEQLSEGVVAPVYGRGVYYAETGETVDDLLQQILSGERTVDSLSATEKGMVASASDSLLASLQELPDQGISGEVQRAIAIGVSGNTRMVLSADDIALLRQMPKIREELGGLGGTTTETPFLESVGIEQIRNLQNGVIVLDLDDAKADPARAFAVRLWLEQNYPELEIQYGREGVWGSLLDKISAPLDYITAPIGAGFRQLSEVTDRVRSPEERAAFLRKADEIEGFIQTGDMEGYAAAREELLPIFNLAGGVDPARGVKEVTLEQAASGAPVELTGWVKEAERAVLQLRDYGTEEVGWNDFVSQMGENTRPRTIGFGFADSFTKATDTLPGDSWYSSAYLSSGLLAAVVLDPLNWGPGLIGGLKAAKAVPKLSRAKYEQVIADAANEIRRTSASGLLDAAGKPIYGMTQADAAAAARKATLGVVDDDYWYPIVGRGWMKNTMYRKFAQTPEELMASRPFVRATKRLAHLKEAVGEKEFFSALTRFFGQDFRRGGGQEVAKALSKAEGEADMGMTLMRGILGMDNSPLKLDEFVDELGEVTRQLDSDALRPALSADEKARLIGRRAHLEDVIKGREYVRPMTQVLTRKNLRQLERRAGAGYGVYGKALEHVVHFGEKFPGNLLNKIPAGDDARDAMIAFENMYKPTGAGEVIVLPHIAKRAGAIRAPGGMIVANAVEDGPIHLSEIGRMFGLSDRRINELMGGYADLIDNASAHEGYEWLKNTWEQMVDEAPRLPSFAKQDLKQMWRGHTSDRSPSWLTTAENDPRPVLYREVIDPQTGQTTRIGRPAIEADQLTVWRTPDLKTMREYLTLTQSTMKQWSKAGWAKKTVAGGHHAVTAAWGHINSFWRTAVLGLRLFGALPARIFNEQMLRIAAYDYASLVWHPLEWFQSTHFGATRGLGDVGGFNRLFAEHPGAALGVMVDDLERHPGMAQIKAGREIVTQADGPMYFRSYSERIGRMAASPSVYRWHLPNMEGVRPLRLDDVDDFLDGPIAEALDQPGFLYHVSPRANFEAISREGLRPRGGGVYVGTSWSDADRLSPHRADKIIFRINPENLDEGEFGGYFGEGVLPGVVPPQLLEVLDESGHWTSVVNDSVSRTLGAMEHGRWAEAGKDWIKTYREYGMDPAEAVARTHEEIQQLLGTGEGAEYIKVLMQRGSVQIDEKTFRAGTAELATKLEELKVNNRWVPGAQYFNRSAGDYLPLQRENAAIRFQDIMFRTFYSAPDLALSRSPMYRQLAAREFRNLIGRGYSAEKAKELAHARAARGTADMMFTIGAKTSGEYLLKNLNPFFPAYRELGVTWLKRLPLRVGEGHWALGSAALIRRADIWITFFKETGVIQEAPDGSMYIPIPGLGHLVGALTGLDMPFQAKAPVESIFGILPVPARVFDTDEQGNPLSIAERGKGIFPTLGGLATVGLGLANMASGDRLDMLEDFFTLYGTDSSLGPLALDRFAEAFGFTLPWMTNLTSETHQRLRTWAAIDGARIAYPQMVEEFGRPPDPNTPEGQRWAEEWLHRAEHYATVTYLMRGVASMTLPFSVQFVDEGKEESAAVWQFLNSLPKGEDGGFQSAYIRSFIADYPDFEMYMVGKTVDTREVDNPDETRDEREQAIKDGDIKVRSLGDWAVFALGSNVMFDIEARIGAFYAAAEDPAEFIVNFDAKNQINQFRRIREDYLAFHGADNVDNRIEGQTRAFAEMWEEWEAYEARRDGERTPRLSFEQRRVMEIMELEDDIFLYLSPDPGSSENYQAIKDKIYKKLDYDPTTDIGQAQQWYFGKVQDNYYNEVNRLYNKEMPKAETDYERAAIFQKLRDLANRYNKTFINKDHPEWGEFPSPEEYSFLKLQAASPASAQRQVAEWANLPAYYLTEFQRDMVGYNIPEGKSDAANELTEFVTENEIEFDKAVERYNIQPSETTYEINRAKYDKAYVDKARELGLEDYWRQVNAPAYVTVGRALGLNDKTATWGRAIEMVRAATNTITTTRYEDGSDRYYSASGFSDVAVAQRARVSDAITKWRRNDSEFDKVIGNLQVWLSREEHRALSQQELVDSLFFDVF